MERVPEPLAVLRGLNRVLKPGGQAWLSAPLFYAEHEEPYDFHRSTPVRVEADGGADGVPGEGHPVARGFFGLVVYQAPLASQRLPNRWLFWRIFLALLAHKATHAEMKKKLIVGMPKNYRVVFVKI